MNPIAKFGRIAIGDFVGKHYPGAPEDHLLAAEAWLCRAQDASADGGVSYGFSLLGGWRPSYPETSGYIATTFFRLAKNRNPVYADRAHRIAGEGLRGSAVGPGKIDPRPGTEQVLDRCQRREVVVAPRGGVCLQRRRGDDHRHASAA